MAIVTRESAAEWLDRFARGWEARDTEALVDLFTANGAFWETPFGPCEAGADAIRAGWEELWPYQADRRMRGEVVAVEGDTAWAHWWATYTRLPDRVHRDLDGILRLRFADDGRCRELVEWRHARDDGVVVPT